MYSVIHVVYSYPGTFIELFMFSKIDVNLLLDCDIMVEQIQAYALVRIYMLIYSTRMFRYCEDQFHIYDIINKI